MNASFCFRQQLERLKTLGFYPVRKITFFQNGFDIGQIPFRTMMMAMTVSIIVISCRSKLTKMRRVRWCWVFDVCDSMVFMWMRLLDTFICHWRSWFFGDSTLYSGLCSFHSMHVISSEHTTSVTSRENTCFLVFLDRLRLEEADVWTRRLPLLSRSFLILAKLLPREFPTRLQVPRDFAVHLEAFRLALPGK
ncbi:unnamed protein product [Albugo candida]|uniref:Uncharacterized protein n=1 Tax=Albugo candida TaxID=65357 RepID=A0A024GLZ0_9STRA|nr:unnamed protein product [Albugo candida]|eukprot:CCI47791.1 unnamed protein product [Albugo candida]